MVVSVDYELITFGASVAASVGFGLMYDICRAFSKATGKRAVFDALFWCLACVFCGGIWFFLQNGELRWYMCVASGMSAILYFLTVEKYVFAAFLFLAKIICRFFSIILKILLTPLEILGKILSVYIKKAQTKFFKKVEDENDEKKACSKD